MTCIFGKPTAGAAEGPLPMNPGVDLPSSNWFKQVRVPQGMKKKRTKGQRVYFHFF